MGCKPSSLNHHHYWESHHERVNNKTSDTRSSVMLRKYHRTETSEGVSVVSCSLHAGSLLMVSKDDDQLVPLPPSSLQVVVVDMNDGESIGFIPPGCCVLKSEKFVIRYFVIEIQ